MKLILAIIKPEKLDSATVRRARSGTRSSVTMAKWLSGLAVVAAFVPVRGPAFDLAPAVAPPPLPVAPPPRPVLINPVVDQQ